MIKINYNRDKCEIETSKLDKNLFTSFNRELILHYSPLHPLAFAIFSYWNSFPAEKKPSDDEIIKTFNISKKKYLEQLCCIENFKNIN